MLGFNRNKQTGVATVITIELSQHGFSNTDSHGRSTARFDVVLDVFPEVGEPFRAETHHQFSPLRYPNPGEELTVKYNAEKKSVEIDLSEDARYNPKIFRKENERRRRQEHDTVMSGAPGTPPPGDLGEDAELAELERLEKEYAGRKFGSDGQVNR